MPSRTIFSHHFGTGLTTLLVAAWATLLPAAAHGAWHLESMRLTNDAPAITLHLLFDENLSARRRSVILMLGSLKAERPPAWSTNLLREGFMLAAFTAEHPPDPDPARRPQWLVFDQRFAHSYVLGGARAPRDAGRVIDYLASRSDVNPRKVGWLGSSSTAIPGLSVACREPRLAAIVAFVATGAYRHWLETWHTNDLWRGATHELWPETRALLETADPILHVRNLFPCAVLMISGGSDKVVDPATARAFASAARPFYERDPARLRFVVYDGIGHNLPADVVQLYAEHWFRLYLHPDRDPPPPPSAAENIPASVRRTQINSADHKAVIENRPGVEKK